MTTRIETLRNHCREMSTAEHRPDCPHITAKEPWWDSWSLMSDSVGVYAMRWRGPKPPWSPPPCDGCVTDADRDLFASIAKQVDDYLQLEIT